MADNNDRTVRFVYDVPILADALAVDADGNVELTDDGLEAAYDLFMDGVSDRSGDWYPRHFILCGESYRAGQVCEQPLNHEGEHA